MSGYKKKETIFPSYDAMFQKIQKEQTKEFTEKLAKVNAKIERLQSKINFDEQHRELAKKLIQDYKKESLYESPPYEELTDLEVTRMKGGFKNANSLNEYLDNSEEEENNYEAHLKFRKKALERELEAGVEGTKVNRAKKIKESMDEEELFFLRLYEPFKEQTNHKERGKLRKDHQDKSNNLKENKKKLTEAYLPYLQALAETNVVKWRILN